jgi:hypothetical protein
VEWTLAHETESGLKGGGGGGGVNSRGLGWGKGMEDTATKRSITQRLCYLT